MLYGLFGTLFYETRFDQTTLFSTSNANKLLIVGQIGIKTEMFKSYNFFADLSIKNIGICSEFDKQP